MTRQLYELLVLESPLQPRRRRGRRLPFPRPPADRTAHAKMLSDGALEVGRLLSSRSPEQLRAIFVKMETQDVEVSRSHYDLVGLKPISWRGKGTVVAALDRQGANRFRSSLAAYGEATASSDTRAALYSITSKPMPLTTEDRMSTGLFQKVEALLKSVSPFELVMHVYPPDPSADPAAQIRKALRALQIRLRQEGVVAGCRIQEVAHWVGSEFAEVKATLNGLVLKEILEDLRWNHILWLDVPSQLDMIRGIPVDADISDVEAMPPAAGAPIVCIIDSGVVNHPLLVNAMHSELNPPPFDRSLPHQGDEVPDGGHGTGVAGLALYYDLNDHWEARSFQPIAFLANARIAGPSNTVRSEAEDLFGLGNGTGLLAWLVRKAVRYFQPLGCRIYNLAVCDHNRPFVEEDLREHSLLAQTIDTLSREYDVLFVVSAGNLFPEEVKRLHLRSSYPDYFARISHETRILDPAQALTALTVGATVSKVSIPGGRLDLGSTVLAQPGHIAPFTRTGPGINQSIKPDVVEEGGAYVWDAETNEVRELAALGIRTLSTDITPTPGGVAYPFKRMCGTSVATPRVTWLAARALFYLDPASHPSSDLLRALVVDSCVPPSRVVEWYSSLKDSPRTSKKHWSYLVGYGKPDWQRFLSIGPHRYIAVYDDQTGLPAYVNHDRDRPGSVALFRIPIPSVLKNTGRAQKRLSVSLSYRPPVRQSRARTYPGVRMEWELFRSDAPPDMVVEYMTRADDSPAQERPTIPSCYRLDKKALFGRRRRSKGTLQHDVFEWRKSAFQSDADLDDFLLAVGVAPNWEGLPIEYMQPYALVVSLEFVPATLIDRAIDIYEPVTNRLKVRTTIETTIPATVHIAPR